jgi:hypothetical protein
MDQVNKKKIFFDTEFTGLHKHTTLISIGLISDCGQTFYAEFTDYDTKQIDPWLQENVIDKLILDPKEYHDGSHYHFPGEGRVADSLIRGNKFRIARALNTWLLKNFVKEPIKLEFWSDCLSFDWVLFCDLYGSAFDVPDFIYYIPFDICTLFKIKNVDPDINREEFAFSLLNYKDQGILSKLKHNAMHDARVIKACYEKAINYL